MQGDPKEEPPEEPVVTAEESLYPDEFWDDEFKREAEEQEAQAPSQPQVEAPATNEQDTLSDGEFDQHVQQLDKEILEFESLRRTYESDPVGHDHMRPHLLAAMEYLRQKQGALAQVKHEKHVHAQQNKLLTEEPRMADPGFRQRVAQFIRSEGFTEAEVASLSDARAVLVAIKAMEARTPYRAATKKRIYPKGGNSSKSVEPSLANSARPWQKDAALALLYGSDKKKR